MTTLDFISTPIPLKQPQSCLKKEISLRIDSPELITSTKLSSSFPQCKKFNYPPPIRLDSIHDDYDVLECLHKSQHTIRSSSEPLKASVVRKCAYIIAAMKPELFISKGAEEIKIDEELSVYILQKVYDGTSTGETCAIIGLPKKKVMDLFDTKNKIYQFLRSCPQLCKVPGIDSLSPYRLNSMKFMFKFFYSIHDSEIILFNIEPKGTDIIEKMYPYANICLPGGGLEDKDLDSLDMCARREFTEETGFEIPQDTSLYTILAKQKFTYTDRQSMYYIYRFLDIKQVCQ